VVEPREVRRAEMEGGRRVADCIGALALYPPAQAGMEDARVVLVTAPDEESAMQLARELVARKLVACVNVLSGVRSVYRWQGEVREDAEVLLIAKTVAARIAELEAAIAELHPYEVPECIAVAPASVERKYLAWLCAESAP
jgi:periplasmic divalent cation tolerance protein